MAAPIKSVRFMMWAIALSALAVCGYQAWRRALSLEKMAQTHESTRLAAAHNLKRANKSLRGAGGSVIEAERADKLRIWVASLEAEVEYEARRRDYLLRARFFPWLPIESDPARRPR